MYFQNTTKNIARNPIARAIAKKRLREQLTTHKISLYMTESGEDCREIMSALCSVLSVIGHAAELDKNVGRESLDYRILLGGLSACSQMLKTGVYDSMQTVSIDKALDCAERLNSKLSQDCVNKAYHKMKSICT
jgi:hypothetical protein